MHFLGWALVTWIGFLIALLIGVIAWLRPPRRKPWRG